MEKPKQRSSLKMMLEEWSEATLGLSRPQVAKLILLDDLVVQWGSAVRLVGYRNERQRFERYYCEALQACSELPEAGIAVDVGSGGGTPAVPLAIVRPTIQWVLLEPNKKKAIFLEEAARSLALSNLVIRRERYDVFTPARAIDVVTTRGLTVGEELLGCAGRWLARGGHLLLWTGKSLKEEMAQRWSPGWALRREQALAPRYDTWLLKLERMRAPD